MITSKLQCKCTSPKKKRDRQYSLLKSIQIGDDDWGGSGDGNAVYEGVDVVFVVGGDDVGDDIWISF